MQYSLFGRQFFSTKTRRVTYSIPSTTTSIFLYLKMISLCLSLSLKAQVFLPKQILFQTSPQQNSQLSHRWPLTSFEEVFPKFLSLSGTPCWLHGGSLQRFCLAAPTTRCQCCVCGEDAKNLEVLYHAFTWPGEKVGVGVVFLGGGFK